MPRRNNSTQSSLQRMGRAVRRTTTLTPAKSARKTIAPPPAPAPKKVIDPFDEGAMRARRLVKPGEDESVLRAKQRATRTKKR